jgi:hypothetical protein
VAEGIPQMPLESRQDERHHHGGFVVGDRPSPRSRARPGRARLPLRTRTHDDRSLIAFLLSEHRWIPLARLGQRDRYLGLNSDRK